MSNEQNQKNEPSMRDLYSALIEVAKELKFSRESNKELIEQEKKRVFWQTFAMCVVVFVGLPFIYVIYLAL